MSQIHTFSMTTARRSPAPKARRAADIPLAFPGVSMRFPALVRRLLAQLRRLQLRRTERAALSKLAEASDHLLDDIGISRHELTRMLDLLDG